jgi:hypothetical protein
MKREQPSKVWKEGILKAIAQFKSGDLQKKAKVAFRQQDRCQIY